MVDGKYFYLAMITGDRTGTNFLLDPRQANSLGRGMDCDIVMADPLCSRVHAELVCEQDRWWIVDAGSRNGSFVNEQKAGKVELSLGDKIRLGSTVFLFQSADQPPTLALTRDTRLT